MEGGRIVGLGTSPSRKEDSPLLMGNGSYSNDVKVLVGSPHTRAGIEFIDTEAAEGEGSTTPPAACLHQLHYRRAGKVCDRPSRHTDTTRNHLAGHSREQLKEGAEVALSKIQVTSGAANEIESTYQCVGTLVLETDVTDEASTQSMVAETVAKFGRPDTLITNTAMFAHVSHNKFLDIPVEEWNQLMKSMYAAPGFTPNLPVPKCAGMSKEKLSISRRRARQGSARYRVLPHLKG